MSTIWNVILYQHLSHDSWPLCFLTPHLVPINIYLCSLVIFVRVLTTKVTQSCSFKSWFMLGLTMRTAILGLDPSSLQMAHLYHLGYMAMTVGQTMTFLVLFTSPLCLAQACVWQWLLLSCWGPPPQSSCLNNKPCTSIWAVSVPIPCLLFSNSYIKLSRGPRG
jgi:hypothetical protein